MNRRLNYTIRTVAESSPKLAEQYRRECEIQRKIEKRKREGRKIPARWITNPFHLKYYRDTGRLE